MKIDRSFGVPFVKGYVNITLDEDKYKEYVKSNETTALCYLLLNSINFKFKRSDLFEAGTKVEISNSPNSFLQISFSTYNDLLDKVVDLIMSSFKEPVNEAEFNVLKDRYYLSKATNGDNPHSELIFYIFNLLKSFNTCYIFK